MICPNCKSETFRLTTVCDDNNQPFSFCSNCPRPAESKPVEFPAILTSKRKRGRPPKIENSDKFDKFKLSENERQKTQALASKGVRFTDTLDRRLRDAVDKGIETIFVGTDSGANIHRTELLNKKFVRKFGHNNFKIIYDDGNLKAKAIPLQ